MKDIISKNLVLAKYPEGVPKESYFLIKEVAIREIDFGYCLCGEKRFDSPHSFSRGSAIVCFEGKDRHIVVNYHPLKWLASGFCVPASANKKRGFT